MRPGQHDTTPPPSALNAPEAETWTPRQVFEGTRTEGLVLSRSDDYSGKTNPMIGRLSVLAVAAPLLVAFFGCSELPEIPEGECGNLVVETGEDCDGFDTQGTVCRAPGSTGECHWDCQRDSPEPHACPAGFGCDADGVCRRPRAEFAAVAEAIPGNAESLQSGDFDGDGRDDVLTTEPALTFGITKVRIHYFDERGQQTRSWSSGKFLIAPAVRELTGDARADVVFSDSDLGVLSGSAEGALLPYSYPSYFLNSHARILPVSSELIDDSTAFLVFADLKDGLGLHRLDEGTAFKRIVGLDRGVDELIADLAIGEVFDTEHSGCMEIVLGFRGDSEFSLVSSCARDPSSGVLRWLEQGRVRKVELEPKAALTDGLILADLNADGHLDVMVGTDAGPFASFGDGAKLSSATPYTVLAVMDDSPDPVPVPGMPLAAGDLNSDQIADLVYPDAVTFTYFDPASQQVLVRVAQPKFGKPWTEAVIADLNGNGLLDVAAISRDSLDIDVFNGSGSGVNRFVVPTDRANEHLAVGDFDGDFVNDLVFVQRDDLSGEPDYLSIAFGNPSGPPGTPITEARLDGIVQVAPFRVDVDRSISDLVVSYEQNDSDGDPGTSVSLFTGSGDRFLSSPIELSSFADMKALEAAVTYLAATAALTSPEAIDFLAVGDVEMPGVDPRRGIWMLADLPGGRAAPRELGWPFDDDLQLFADDGRLTMHLANGDLDGDGLDELLLSASNESGQCVVSAGRLGADGEQLERVGRVAFDDACGAGADLRAFDIDGEPGAEVLVLTGDFDSPRQLVVVSWNGGDFQAEAIAPAPGEDAPQAFTSYRSTPDADAELAYVTATGLYLRPLARGPHPLGEARKLGELERGTGITAADVNGDGVSDLAVADRGQVRIWRALLDNQ
jgi:hypothetical protein